MKVRLTAMWAIVALLVGVMPALAQVQTGEITGKVSDDTGAVLPGATVTLTSAALIQPQVATSSEAGSFRFPQIPIGTYSVKFELPGFKTVIREGIVVTIGFTAPGQSAARHLHRAGNGDGERREPDRRHESHGSEDDVRPRVSAEHPVGA